MNPTKKQLSFTERMAGHALFKVNNLMTPQPNSTFLEAESHDDRQDIEFTLTIIIEDMDQFMNDPKLRAKANGTIQCNSLGGSLAVLDGKFNLFIPPEASQELNTAKEMHYTLFFEDNDKQKLTFYGYKAIQYADGIEAWSETTTLYFYIWKGHSEYQINTNKETIACGVLHISVSDFIQQLQTIQTNGQNYEEKGSIIKQFGVVFAGNLWEAYAPFEFDTERSRWNEHIYPLHTTIGVVAKEKSLFTFNTKDGLSLVLQRFKNKDSKNIVLLVHGLTSSSDMFMMPEHYNFINYLLKNGYSDVWTLDWRGSNRFFYNLTPHRYTVDDVATDDLPRAIEEIHRILRQESKTSSLDTKIHIVAHCIGSLSVACSLAGGYLKNIQSFVSNSVSLTPSVHWQTRIKLALGPDLLEYLFRYPYVSPKIPYFPGFGFGRWIYWMERTLRRECTEPSCHMLSFMWGWGFPALFNHKNLHPSTHRRLMDLFGGTSFHYYRHVRKMISNGEALPYKREGHFADLPESYLQGIRQHGFPPTLLLSGTENHVFPDSNRRTFEKVKQINPQQNIEYRELPGYGHQDPFMGIRSHVEVFPPILKFLNQHKG